MLTSEYETGKAAIFKLSNGHEIIGRVKDVNGNIIGLEKVREIGLTQDWKLQLAPYFLSGPDAIVDIDVSLIALRIRHVPDDLEREYLQSVSGIQITNNLSSIR